MVLLMPRAAFLISALLLPASLAAATQATLLDFSLATCGPCRQMDPVVARLEAEGFAVKRVDGGRSPQVAQRFRVDRYPTFVVMAGGREVNRVIGVTTYESLRGMLVSAARQGDGASGVVAPRGPATFRTIAGAAGSNAALQPAGGAPPIDVPGRRPKALAPAPSADADALLNATVRLTVKDATGQSYGAGTVIDAREGEALVLTCAHLFRGPDGKQITTPGSVTVELYHGSGGRPQAAERVALQSILSCNFESDLALVTLRPQGQVAPARVAADPGGLRQGDPVLSCGCDHGADPSVRTGVVTAINRYQGPANVTVSGAPVVGRSGGGLFSAKGEVVGVCNAADNEEDEGIYSALAEVHTELDRLRLSAIYRGGPLHALAANERPAADAEGRGAEQEPMAPLTRSPAAPTVRAQDAGPVDTLAALSSKERAALQEIVQRVGESEVVCVIRPKSGQARSQVLTLESVSPEFVRALLAARYSQTEGEAGL